MFVKKLEPMIVKKLKEFRVTSKLKYEALKVMVNVQSGKQVKELSEAFQLISSEGNGVITEPNLEKALKECGIENAV